MGLFDILFGDTPNAAGAANQYYQQIPDAMRPYLDPAFQRGERAGGSLEEQYGSMAQDPTALINEIMGKYQPSDAYKYQQGQMSQAAANSAAAGGMRGTPYEQAEQQKLTQGLLSQDMQQWLQNALGVKGTGLQGQQNLYGMGLGAGTNMAESLANVLGTQGSMAFRDALQKQQNQSDMWGNIFKGLGGLGSAGKFL